MYFYLVKSETEAFIEKRLNNIVNSISKKHAHEELLLLLANDPNYRMTENEELFLNKMNMVKEGILYTVSSEKGLYHAPWQYVTQEWNSL